MPAVYSWLLAELPEHTSSEKLNYYWINYIFLAQKVTELEQFQFLKKSMKIIEWKPFVIKENICILLFHSKRHNQNWSIELN